jgi:DNA polymerase-1
MELRAAAHISGDAVMSKAFEDGLDLHRITAAGMSGKNPEDVTDEERRAAKTVNFGAAFGMGAGGLMLNAWDAYGITLTENEARAWLNTFVRTYPTFAAWRFQHYEKCKAAHRIVIGKDAALGVGRVFLKAHLRGEESFYTRSCNLPIQGICANIAMLALAYVDERLWEAGIEGGPVAWPHDEIVMEVRIEQASAAAAILKSAMIDAFVENLPGAPLRGLVEPHVGMSWGEAKAGEASPSVEPAALSGELV